MTRKQILNRIHDGYHAWGKIPPEDMHTYSIRKLGYMLRVINKNPPEENQDTEWDWVRFRVEFPCKEYS